MLFNSHEFIFVFLPITLLAFFMLGCRSRVAALRWLIFASLVFYVWWKPINLLLIAPSILFNFGIARALHRISRDEQPVLAKTLLVVGITFNVLFICYFKYTGFFAGALNDVLGTNFVVANVLLPLGISFITFQKIAFLIDVSAGRVAAFTFEDYCLFVFFFPQLIVGPIVHYRELMPQFRRITCRYDREDIAVGLTLFAFGLCKKTFLADGIAPQVAAIFGQAAAGQPISLLPAWMAAIGFTLQIYFDFSGYTDMALGVARCFGIRLPPNFNSPLRSTSIIDFWLRWHMTLSRFLTAYIYNPFSLWLTRRRLERGLRGVSGRNTSLGAFLTLVMLPTLLTMSISGLWHGAGYVFLLWGLLHGLYLTINQAWLLIARPWRRAGRYRSFMGPAGFALTFLGVVASMVFFRSPSTQSSLNMLSGMLGLHGTVFPSLSLAGAGSLTNLPYSLHLKVGLTDIFFVPMAARIVGLLAIVWFMPNTLQIMAWFEPALGFTWPAAYLAGPSLKLKWQPSWVWACAISVTAIVGILNLHGHSEFLYWHF